MRTAPMPSEPALSGWAMSAPDARDPARTADDVLCTCYAWDPVAHRHDANDHDQDCWWAKGYKSDVPCGGCWGCLSAQVAHAEVQQRLIDGPGAISEAGDG